MTNIYDNQHDIDEQPTFEDALAELQSDEGVVPSYNVFAGLSNLTPDEVNQLTPVLTNLDPTYRRVLMQMLVDYAEANYELNYQPIARTNIYAQLAEVRRAALELIVEEENLDLLGDIIKLAQTDEALDVRVEAIRSLGNFVLHGELEDLPHEQTRVAEEVLLTILNDSEITTEIRRYALESISHCSRKGIADIIRDAYASEDEYLRQSAIVAMGHSCDTKRWSKNVLKELENRDPDMRRKAAGAAGELQLEDAVPILVNILDVDDRDAQEIAIWSLGEIGGGEALNILQRAALIAEEAEDEELLILIDDAINNASLMNGDLFMMTDLDDTDLDD